MLLTITITVGTSYYVNRQEMIKMELAENQSNAKKLSALTNDNFKIMQDSLVAQHKNILEHWNEPKQLEDIVTSIRKSNFNFNTVTIIGADGKGKANNPDLNLVGKVINTKGAQKGLRLKKNFISDPYIGPNNKLMLIVSTALYKNGKYFGMVNGLVWLQEKNFLTHLLEETYGDRQPDILVYGPSYTYIYHKDREKIGTRVYGSPLIKDSLKTGSMMLHQEEGSYLAGYAVVPMSQWHIVSLTFEKETLTPAAISSLRTLMFAIPFILMVMVLLFILISFITKPLKRLANFNYERPLDEIIEKSSMLNTPYREVESIKKTILSFVKNQKKLLGELEDLTVTDPLTGLANRRRLNQVMDEVKSSGKPFGYIVMDIDYFKQVNDTYGHSVGDQVLVQLAKIIQSESYDSGLAVRTGGEEFAIVIQNVSSNEVECMGEHLRKVVEETDFLIPRSITLSLGIGYLDCATYDLDTFYEEVDKKLYTAKKLGRNRSESVFIVNDQIYIH